MALKQTNLIFSLCTVLFLLGGCSSVKETLGMNRHSPDEFSVVKRAPLSMPPDYALRPPRPGAPRPQEQSPDKQAAQSVLGIDPNSGNAAAPTQAEQILLEQAGAESASSSIRQVVDQESVEEREDDRPVVDKLLDFRKDKKPTAVVVDAEKELERLRENQAEGKPVTEGETPSVDN